VAVLEKAATGPFGPMSDRISSPPPNQAASSNGAITVPFHIGRPGRAVHEQRCSAKLMTQNVHEL